MRRDTAHLDALVTEALEAVGPATAIALAAWLRAQGHGMPDAQVYRVMRRLVSRGIARQIWLGRRFVIAAPHDDKALTLACRGCGRLDFAPALDAEQAIRSHAIHMEFKIEQVILEIAGLCERCALGAGAQATRRAS